MRTMSRQLTLTFAVFAVLAKISTPEAHTAVVQSSAAGPVHASHLATERSPDISMPLQEAQLSAPCNASAYSADWRLQRLVRMDGVGRWVCAARGENLQSEGPILAHGARFTTCDRFEIVCWTIFATWLTCAPWRHRATHGSVYRWCTAFIATTVTKSTNRHVGHYTRRTNLHWCCVSLPCNPHTHLAPSRSGTARWRTPHTT